MSLIKWKPLNNEIDTFDNIIDQFFNDLSFDPRFSLMNTNNVSNSYKFMDWSRCTNIPNPFIYKRTLWSSYKIWLGTAPIEKDWMDFHGDTCSLCHVVVLFFLR